MTLKEFEAEALEAYASGICSPLRGQYGMGTDNSCAIGAVAKKLKCNTTTLELALGSGESAGVIDGFDGLYVESQVPSYNAGYQVGKRIADKVFAA